MENRIKKILGNIFNIDQNLINKKTSSSNIAKWDSIKHMNLIMALEEEFNTEFTDEEIIYIMSYPRIVAVLKKKLSAAKY
jgi:acyl carrier protein